MCAYIIDHVTATAVGDVEHVRRISMTICVLAVNLLLIATVQAVPSRVKEATCYNALAVLEYQTSLYIDKDLLSHSAPRTSLMPAR